MPKNRNEVSGAMPFAKPSGVTSFSSLWSIKRALGTEKLGHTGTLDAFADGLLVVLAGGLTRLVPHITGLAKTYEAVACFGRETDTLDPTGEVTASGNPAKKSDIEKALEKFRGAILQVPPAFSALHVDGKRASDLARAGREVRMEPRQIFVYEAELLGFREEDGLSYGHFRIVCSKGTYIRALARDIAREAGTVAHLCALRRTRVGPFRLEDAACFGELGEFTMEAGIEAERIWRSRNAPSMPPREKSGGNTDSPGRAAEIRSRFLEFTEDLARSCGLESVFLRSEFERHYMNGRPLSRKMFSAPPASDEAKISGRDLAVFYGDGKFGGMVCERDGRLSYGFVAPHSRRAIRIFSWEDIVLGAFPVQWRQKGSALTVGGFEAVHAGHRRLLELVASHGELARGIVTFSSSIKADDGREIFTLRQRLSLFEEAGLDFAVVVDFTDEFRSMPGLEFIGKLSESCGMRFLAEGADFKCGRGGECGMDSILEMSRSMGFTLEAAECVMHSGEKISSSRIRSEIARGNFACAEEMLLRPFEFCARGLEWRGRRRGDGLVFSAIVPHGRLLPDGGLFPVAARLDDGSCLRLDCAIEKTEPGGGLEISLPLPSENFSGRVLSIVF